MKFKLTPNQIPTQQYYVARPSVGSKPKRSSSNSSAHKDDRDTSTKSKDNGKNWDHDKDTSPHDHKVAFEDCVHQHTFKTALGNHPDTTDGPPVDLGSLVESNCTPLKDTSGRHGHVHRLSEEDRIQMLKDNGYTQKDIKQAMREAQRVHENRVRTSRSASPANNRSRSASPANRGSFRRRGNNPFGFSGIQYQIPNQQVYVARSASPSNRSRSASPSNKSRGQSQFGFSGISKFK